MTLATLLLAFVLGLGLAPRADAEIFKCAGHRNLPTYQNFPCEFDSLGAASTTPRSPLGSPVSSGAPAAAAKPYAPVAQGHSTPARAPSAIPRVGMTSDEVRHILGEPAFTTTEEHAKKDIEVWSYADSRSIEFDRNERVTAIRW